MLSIQAWPAGIAAIPRNLAALAFGRQSVRSKRLYAQRRV
jgi:hypothetical protein